MPPPPPPSPFISHFLEILFLPVNHIYSGLVKMNSDGLILREGFKVAFWHFYSQFVTNLAMKVVIHI